MHSVYCKCSASSVNIICNFKLFFIKWRIPGQWCHTWYKITFYFCTTLKTSIAQILEVILKLAVLPGYVYVATKWTLTLFQTYVHWLFWRNLASTAIKRQGWAADSVLESQTQFLKMWHYLSVFFSVCKLSLPLCGLPAWNSFLIYY